MVIRQLDCEWCVGVPSDNGSCQAPKGPLRRFGDDTAKWVNSRFPANRELSRQPSLVTIGGTRPRGRHCILVRTMLRSFAHVVIGLALAHLTAQGQPSIPPSSGDDEKQLLALERQWVDAEVKHDAAFLDRILDDRFIVIDSQGRTQDKAAFVATVLKSAMASQTLSDETVRIFGDTAIIFGTDTRMVNKLEPSAAQ